MYIHCAGHSLNLVISSCCGLPEIQNISKVKEVCIFFNYSPERNGFLSEVIKDQYYENIRKKPLITLCTTRWAERSEAYEHFYESFEYVVYVLEVMAHNLHHDDCPAQFYGCWNAATKRDASGLLQAITNFQFVVTFVIGYLYLSHMTAVTTKLQRKSNDIFKAFTMTRNNHLWTKRVYKINTKL